LAAPPFAGALAAGTKAGAAVVFSFDPFIFVPFRLMRSWLKQGLP
jgi:hypothetical protein